MIPFLVLSDAPSATTGLARITRELLKHMRTDPETASVFRIGSLGVGQRSYISHPYPQYPGTLGIYGVPETMDVWRDFSQGQDGIVFSIMNPDWMRWIHEIPRRPFSLWGYFPIDCEGPSGTVPKSILNIVNGFDRKLAYCDWAAKMIDSEWLPHGIDTSIFYPRQKTPHDGLHIGVCATNTRRKDWALAAETIAILQKRHKVRFFAHTDREIAEWHLPELFDEFGITDNVTITSKPRSENEMAEWYANCDVTLAIGSGEGFGYPIAESIACGVPCIHGWYAGGAYLIPKSMRVEPVAYRYDGLDSRPVFDAKSWADLAWQCSRIYNQPQGPFGYYITPTLPEQYDWNNLWPKWKQWLLKGVQ